jgi:hypothetical protein
VHGKGVAAQVGATALGFGTGGGHVL